MTEEGVRINKYLSEAGACSRREADRHIEAGEVTIDGRIAGMGDRVYPGQEVKLQGRSLSKEEEMILLAFHKPEGIVCTAEKREKNNIIDYLNYPKRIYPIGRLDKDSTGLILLTNNGDIVNKMMRSGNLHEKEYIVTVNKQISEPFLRGMAGGVPLVELNATTRPCKVEKITNHKFRIILTQGLNRQIRRMCDYFGYHVDKLQRVRVMNIELGDLPVGQYRQVTGEEYEMLLKLINRSSNAPVRAGSRKPLSEKSEDVREREKRRQEAAANHKAVEASKPHYSGTYSASGTVNREFVSKKMQRAMQKAKESGEE